MIKKLLRNKLRTLRNAITPYNRKRFDKLIEKNLLSLEEFKNSSTIMFFVGFNSEVNTLPIIRKSLLQTSSKTVIVPKIINTPNVSRCPTKILPVRIKNSNRELKKGVYGILEPRDTKNKINPEQIDLVLVPGLGFDIYGNRLGYGGGYYDNFLKKIHLKKRVGLCYEIQILHKIPTCKSDLPVSKIVTEKGVKICHKYLY